MINSLALMCYIFLYLKIKINLFKKKLRQPKNNIWNCFKANKNLVKLTINKFAVKIKKFFNNILKFNNTNRI